ncbi:MAG: hypothetical protein EPN24_06370 [Candidatus Methanoperedens sp.]|nr:MAG: hypothetical protein EPN24_06370 [Candidatus Methanoperedens sp.]
MGGKDAVGYIMVLDNYNIYFAGDTLYSDEVVKDVNDFKIHVALLPIGSAKVLSKKVVMDTRDAIRFALDTCPNVVIPMHYNTLKERKLIRRKLEWLYLRKVSSLGF